MQPWGNEINLTNTWPTNFWAIIIWLTFVGMSLRHFQYPDLAIKDLSAKTEVQRTAVGPGRGKWPVIKNVNDGHTSVDQNKKLWCDWSLAWRLLTVVLWLKLEHFWCQIRTFRRDTVRKPISYTCQMAALLLSVQTTLDTFSVNCQHVRTLTFSRKVRPCQTLRRVFWLSGRRQSILNVIFEQHYLTSVMWW